MPRYVNMLLGAVTGGALAGVMVSAELHASSWQFWAIIIISAVATDVRDLLTKGNN